MIRKNKFYNTKCRSLRAFKLKEIVKKASVVTKIIFIMKTTQIKILIQTFKATFNRLMDNFNIGMDNLCACNSKIIIKCFNSKFAPIKITTVQ